MARRNGRKGAHLVTDDYFGFTRFNSQVKKDYWGSYAEKPMLRNLQEIAYPLNDPGPVDPYRGPNYETYSLCDIELAPQYVGLTNVKTNPNNAAMQALGLQDAIPNMEIGCDFVVA